MNAVIYSITSESFLDDFWGPNKASFMFQPDLRTNTEDYFWILKDGLLKSDGVSGEISYHWGDGATTPVI